MEQEADFDTAAKRSDKTLEEPQLPSLSAAADSVEESDENANGQPSNNSTKKRSAYKLKHTSFLFLVLKAKLGS